MAERTISTKPLLQKLGLKREMRIAVLGFSDRTFMEDFEFDTSLRADPNSEDTGYDAILFHATTVEALRPIRQVKKSLKGSGMLWVAYPRGVKVITQAQVFFHGNAEGFTDCKVCRFSETLTALKFVRRLENRS